MQTIVFVQSNTEAPGMFLVLSLLNKNDLKDQSLLAIFCQMENFALESKRLDKQ